jgi:hypothetical protein
VVIPVVTISIGPDDLPLVVDACRIGEIAVGKVECSVAAVIVEEALLAGTICKVKSDNLAVGIYTIGY